MRVISLNTNLSGIGTYRRSFNFSRELARLGHDVTMVTVSRRRLFGTRSYFKTAWIGESAQPDGNGPWVRMIEGSRLLYKALPGWGAGPLDIAVRLKEIVRGDFDVVLGFEYQPNVSWPIYATRPFLRYGFVSDWCDWFAGASNTMRGIKLAHKVDGFFEERIRRVADIVTVTSRTLFDRAVSVGVPRDRIVRIPEGVDTEHINPSGRDDARRKLGVRPDTPLLATVQDTDMHTAIRIFSEVVKAAPAARLLVIGMKNTQTARAVEEFNVQASVMETGWVTNEEYASYLAAADLCYLPLEDDIGNRARWPAKVNDYMAAGCATVITRVGDVARRMEDDGVGVLVSSPDEMVDVSVTLLRDGERLRHLGRVARKVMEEKWDWRHSGEQIAKAATRAMVHRSEAKA